MSDQRKFIKPRAIASVRQKGKVGSLKPSDRVSSTPLYGITPTCKRAAKKLQR